MTYDPEKEFDDSMGVYNHDIKKVEVVDRYGNVIDEIPDVPEPDEESSASILVPPDVIKVIQAAPAGTDILNVCLDTAVFLASKNIAYGNSALDPVRIFSKADPREQILVRMDDKISRLARGTTYAGDNDLKDLLGYLVLYFVAERQQAEAE